MLKTEHLTLNFGGLTAVNDINIEIKENQITGLIGPNGAGKTSLFNCLTGVYRPNSGSIIFNEKHIEGLRGFQINAVGIARTYQLINLFRNMTVFENVMVGSHSGLQADFWSSLLHTKRMREEEEKVAKTAMDLLDFVGLKKKMNDKAGSLSYGEQRLLEIVRGMASSPKLICLDEPAAGMNTTEKKELDALLHQILERGITILIIEHDIKLIMNVTDYIYVMNNGRLLASGVPEQVRNNPDVITAYLGGE